MNYNVAPQPYQSMYVDMKLPEIAQIERDRFDMASAEKDAIDRSIGSIRLLDGDISVKNRLNADVKNIIGERVDFENMGRVVKDATTRLLTDTKLLDAADSYATRQKELEAENAMRAQGLKPLDFNYTPVLDQNGKAVIDPATGLPMRQHKSEVWNTETQGKYRTGIEEKLKWEDKAQQLIAGIADDSGPIQKAAIAAGISDDERRRWLSTGQGVTRAKIDRLATELTKVFDQTAEGRQMRRELQELAVNPATSTLHSDAEVTGKMKELLLSVGAKQEGWVNNPFKSAIDYDAQASEAALAALPANTIPVQSSMPATFDLSDFVQEQVVKGYAIKSNGPAGAAVRQPFQRIAQFDKTGKYISPSNGKAGADLKKKLEGVGGDWRKVNKEWLENNKEAIVDYVQDPMNGYKKFQLKNETDAEFTSRMGQVLGSIQNEELTILPDPRGAAKSMLQGESMTKFYNENGIPMDDLESLADDGSAVFGFELSAAEIRQAINNTLKEDWDGEGIPAAEISLVTKGDRNGSFKVVIPEGDNKKKIFYMEPQQDMPQGFEVATIMNTYAGSKSVQPLEMTSAAKSLYGNAVGRAYAVNTPVGNVMQTNLVIVPVTGKPFTIPLEEIQEEVKQGVLNVMSNQPSQAAESINPTYRTQTKFGK
jgi:hypothetical protein